MTNLHPDSSGEFVTTEPPETPTVVVGDNPWDADPDTYTVQTTPRKSGLGQIGYTIGTWNDPPPAEMTDLTLHMRYRARNYGPDASGGRVQITLSDPTTANLYLIFTALADDVLMTDEADHELVIPVDPDLLAANATDLATVQGQMSSGPYSVLARRLTSAADTLDATPLNRYELTITELYLEAVTAAVPTPVLVTRLHPRDDAYGLGSAPRIFPPPRSGRIVGGHQ